MHQSGTIFTGVDCIKSLEHFFSQEVKRYSGIFILTDTNSRMHCLPLLMGQFKFPEDTKFLETEPGEQNKNLQVCTKVWQELAALGADRYSLLICLGGGVVCDLGGFVASTYQRGIDFIFFPTTLLAQVDAAIGGKTGVNLGKLKNYVGLFSPPNAVYIMTSFLQTLPYVELLSGYAEVVKHSLLSSEKYYHQLVLQFPDINAIQSTSNWETVVERSVKIKNNVVQSDPYEKGLRKVLNLGHTAGHAFESYALAHYGKPLPHGFAVAMGLIVELDLSVIHCGFDPKLASEISDYLLSVFPFYAFASDKIPEITQLMGFDKKNKAGAIQMTLIKKPGDLITDVACSHETIEKSLIEYLSKGNSFGFAKTF
ncbi:MAG: 3-dehydroquinate synthase [Bacteroidales bacterium]|nr:3-dehydroquinate synthase [Bacteroidales bacterium]